MSVKLAAETIDAAEFGRGLYWQDMAMGPAFRTQARTVTETDLVSFVTLVGMIESIFLDTTHVGPMGRRPVPGSLTYALSEGFIVQTLIRGTGIAMLASSLEALAPVHVGDTIHSLVEFTGVRPTSKGGRAIVDSVVTVRNQGLDPVLRYTARRMIAGRPGPAQ